MKRTVMLLSGLMLVAAITIAVACGGDDGKKSEGDGTPAIATKTAEAAATIAAGGSPATDEDNDPQPGETQSAEQRATSQATRVDDEGTEEAIEEATDDAEEATEDAEDAAQEAADESRNATESAREQQQQTPDPS